MSRVVIGDFNHDMTAQFASSAPWSHFSAVLISIALPGAVVHLTLQEYMTRRLLMGGVEG